MNAPRSRLAWQDVARLVASLASGLRAAQGDPAFERVVGVARGGLVPAALLATALGVERVETVQVRAYQGTTPLDQGATLLGPAPEAGGRVLVVDEILDSGRTLGFLRALLPEATQAVLVARDPEGGMISEHGLWRDPAGGEGARGPWAAEVLRSDAWVVFPWSPPEDGGAPNA